MLIGCCDFVFHVEIHNRILRLNMKMGQVFEQPQQTCKLTVAFDFDFDHGGG